MILVDSTREVLQGLRAGRRIQGGVRILTYHGVVEDRTDSRVERSFHLLADFRRHVELLRYCDVIALDDLEDALPRRSVRPRVVVTFDDGFRNNLLAADLLCTRKIPFTIFVSTDNVETGRPIWPTLLRLVLARGSARVVRLAGEEYALDRDETAFKRARNLLKSVPTPRRIELWDELVAQLGAGELDELIAAFPSIAMLTWNHVRSLQSTGVSFGSHGYRHELHLADQPAALRARELAASKAQLETATGRACTAFAFPNGTFNDASPGEVRAAGYRVALTMVSRAARPTDDAMLLPRIMPGPKPEKLATGLVFGS